MALGSAGEPQAVGTESQGDAQQTDSSLWPPPKARELRGCAKCVSLDHHGYLCEMPLGGSRTEMCNFSSVETKQAPRFQESS